MYDVIVIGGGVNGTGVARDAALRGLTTLLLEKGDFGAGATGNSSGMIHGGLRYLLSDVATTKKSCLDSGYIQRIAPYLLFRIPLMLPILAGGIRARIQLELTEAFFEAYDRFAPLKNGKPHCRLSPEEAVSLEPGLRPDLAGALTLDEWGIDPYRLCVANAVAARENGAEIRNHTEVVALLRDGKAVKGVVTRDAFTGRTEEFVGRTVVNAAGPWLTKVAGLAGTEVRIRPGKGVHLVLDRRISNVGVISEAIDGRQIFILPYDNVSLIGTTDDDYYGDPDDVAATEDEVEYLLQGMERLLPGIRKHRICATTTGLRPTLFGWGKNEDALSRDHEVVDHEKAHGVPGLLTIAGGKLAAYRLMAEEATDALAKRVGNTTACTTGEAMLPGAESAFDLPSAVRVTGLPAYTLRRLGYRHGGRARFIVDLIGTHPLWARTVCETEPVTEAEIRYVIRKEWAKTVSDIARRTRLGMGPCQGAECALRAAEILASELHAGPDEARRFANEFLAERWRRQMPILSGAQLAQAEFSRGVNFGVHRLGTAQK
ncbi:MAG: FAD-dependent oxidoreductase [Planctomycetes bacterium]|nr:FAD-dependent oxidoreductase [Planctomycetota bacterium]